MSIKKNNTSRTDHTVSIVRFGLIPGTSFYARKYARLTNKYFQLLQYVSNGADYHDTVMILADIPQSAEGYFYGTRDTGGTNWEVSIQKSGSVITWKIGSITASHAWESGAHTYGFVDGKPLYDGQWLSTSASTTVIPSRMYAFVGARNNMGGLTTADVITSIDIYQVLLSAHQTTSSATNTLMTYYPVTDGQSGTVAMLFETRTLNDNETLDSIAGPTRQGVTPSSTPGEQVTYGVQLEDLRYITGSGYHDLMAVMADDGGLQNWATGDAAYISDEDWGITPDPADKLSNGTSAFESAFRLADGTGKAITSGTVIPIPSGYSLSRVQTEGGHNKAYHDTNVPSYEKGDLIFGHKPKWSLWVDGLNLGRYIKKYIPTGMSVELYFLKYNIFRTVTGESKLDTFHDLLGQWEGYSNSESRQHAPSFNIDSEIQMHYHNSVAATCDNTSVLLGGTPGISLSNVENLCVFRYSRSAGGLGHAILGNLPLWDMAATAQPTNYGITGGVLELRYLDDSGWRTIASMVSITDDAEPLSADSSAAMKQKYRVDGFDCSAVFSKELSDTVYRWFGQNDWDPLSLSVSLGLLRTRNQYPTETEVIRTDCVLPAKPSSAIGSKDPCVSASASGYTKDRLILGEPGGKVVINGTEYEFEALGNSRTSSTDYFNLGRAEETGGAPYEERENGISTTYYRGRFLGASFALRKVSDQTFYDFDEGTNLIAFLECTVANAQGELMRKFFAFSTLQDKPHNLNLVTSGESWAFYYNDHFGMYGNTAYPSNTPFLISGTYQYQHMRNAMFRWEDILHQSETKWHYDSEGYVVPDTIGIGRPWLNESDHTQGYAPMTAHIRLFADTVCAWDLSYLVNAIDSYTNCRYLPLGTSAAPKDFLFVNNERVLVKQAANSKIVDGWFTVWTNLGSGTRDTESFRPVNVTLMRVTLHGADTNYNQPNTVYPVETIANFSVLAADNEYTDSQHPGYSCSISHKQRYPGFTVLPDHQLGDKLDGFFNIQIKTTNNNLFSNGDMYYISMTLR